MNAVDQHTVEGLDDLLSKMEALPLTMQKQIIAKALREGAEPIRERAAELAPDDPETPTAKIKTGMMITVTDQSASEAIGKIGPDTKAFYARFQELGTSHQRAYPFLEPAFHQTVDEAEEIIGDTLGEMIEEALTTI